MQSSSIPQQKDHTKTNNNNTQKHAIMNNNETYHTNYAVAVNWLNNDFVMCNHIAEIDNSVIDNARFNWFEEDEEGNETTTEVFQWFITNCSESDI